MGSDLYFASRDLQPVKVGHFYNRLRALKEYYIKKSEASANIYEKPIYKEFADKIQGVIDDCPSL
jgi:hypothetical protein